MLGEGAHIDGRLWLGEGAHTDGNLWLGQGAHIDRSLWLGKGAHIDGRLWLGKGLHINVDLGLGADARLGDVYLHPESGVAAEWFTTAGVPVRSVKRLRDVGQSAQTPAREP